MGKKTKRAPTASTASVGVALATLALVSEGYASSVGREPVASLLKGTRTQALGTRAKIKRGRPEDKARRPLRRRPSPPPSPLPDHPTAPSGRAPLLSSAARARTAFISCPRSTMRPVR